MSDQAGDLIGKVCNLAGVATQWSDIFGKRHEIARDDLICVLSALGIGAESDAELHDSIEQLEREDREPAPLITTERAARVFIPLPAGAWRLRHEDGGCSEGMADAQGAGCSITAPDREGYHRLELGGREITLAVAPRRCFSLADALGKPGALGWGLAVQLYSLRRPGDGGVGDYPALAAFAREAASYGAQALAISPVHAQFSADLNRFSPYAPSSRLMLNALHVDAGHPGSESAHLEAADLVDWPAMSQHRLARLRQQFDAGAAEASDFLIWRSEAGRPLEDHALFEALHQHIWSADPARWDWRDWPGEFSRPDASGIAAFRRGDERNITFHAWLQYRAERELAQAQRAARGAGMPIGLICDLAVGADAGGSHCWSQQGETLRGLTIGAPPDLLQTKGQNWGITAFSARGLRRNGFHGFIEMLSRAMRHAGGVRIDHAMGIARLWVIPEGKSADHGTYLAFPEDDLRRLIKLESMRNRAIVLAEDLGTVPEGFQSRLQQDGIDGMRILQFERDEHCFRPPSEWTRQAAAMTSTHDLPPIAGWWAGHDITTRAAVFDLPQGKQDKEQAERARDRGILWDAMLQSGAATGEAPASWDTDPVADAAIAHAARSASELVMVPIEDVLALREQPNLPGTTNEHPNWRRRLAAQAGEVLSQPGVERRLAPLRGLRGGEDEIPLA